MCYSLLHYYYYILLLHTSYSYFIYIHTSYFEVCVNVLKLKNKLYLLATGYYQLLVLVLPGSCQFASSQQLQLQLERCAKLKVVKVKKVFYYYYYYFRFIVYLLSVCSFAHHHISPYHISHHHLCVIILNYLSPPQLQLAIY